MRVRRSWLWTLVAMLALAAGSYGLFLWLSPPELPEGFVYGSGRIEATEVRVSAEVTARVVESELEEGRAFEAGETLVRLDETDLRTRVRQAEASTRAAELRRERLARELDTWRHHLETAEANLERSRALWETGDVSQDVVERAEDRHREAQGQVGALEAQQAEAEASYAAARHEVEFLRSELDKAAVRAPIAGTVLAKAIEVGELATPGRVVAELADLSDLELKVYIPVPELAKISLGDSARVRVDAFPERYYEARVVRIDRRAVFTPRDVYMPDERARIVHRVTLAVEAGDGGLHPGMPADAWIRWQAEREWPAKLPVPR